VCTPTSYN